MSSMGEVAMMNLFRTFLVMLAAAVVLPLGV